MLRVALKMLVGDRTKYAGCSSASHSLRSWSRSLRRIFCGFHHTRICSDRREPIGGRLGHAPGG